MTESRRHDRIIGRIGVACRFIDALLVSGGRFAFVAIATTLLVLLGDGSSGLGAQTPKEPPLRHSPVASIDVGDGWLDVRFPMIPLSELGCRGADSISLTWGAFQNFADTPLAHDHSMALIAWFRLPSAPDLTESLLDSGLARAEFQIFKRFSRFGPREEGPPVRNAWLVRDGDHIRLRVENDSVVAAFMKPRANWGVVHWCQRDVAHGFVTVPIDRH